MPSRRVFLKSALASLAWSLLPVGRSGWAYAAPSIWPFDGFQSGGPGRLIVILLRGAIDGLSVVVPYTDTLYYDLRPRIAIPKPGQEKGALDLDGRFALNPSLAPLLPLWKDGSLAFVHACGSHDPTRSHFDAQDYMETALPGATRTLDGWMNRLLAHLPGPHAPNTAISIGTTIPRVMSGQQAVASLSLGNGAARKLPPDAPNVGAVFDRLYSDDADPLARAYREGRAARKLLLDDLTANDAEMKAASGPAPLPDGFARDAAQLAHLLRRDAGIRLAFLDLGGWDTHVNQVGTLGGRLKSLGEGLAVLARELGPTFSDTTVVVMSEFGRTVAENGTNGTDHGHGNVMWLLGGGVRGGKVYGRWPGLEAEQRFQGRDLAVTTDFRQVLKAVLRDRMKLDAAAIASILPGLEGGAHDLEGLFASNIRPWV